MHLLSWAQRVQQNKEWVVRYGNRGHWKTNELLETLPIQGVKFSFCLIESNKNKKPWLLFNSQEVQLCSRKATSNLGIGFLCVLLLGGVQQNQVSLIHQVHGVKQPRYEVEHLIYPLSSLVSWALSLLLMLSRHIDIWQIFSGGRTWRHFWALCRILLFGRLWYARRDLMHC